MKKLAWLVGSVFAFVLASLAASAQYSGWQIPEGGLDEKSPLQSTPQVVQKGKAIFTANCQKCHGATGQGDGPDSNPNAPAADLTDDFRTSINPDGALFYKVWNGRSPQMPAFKSTLSKEEVWTVVEYAKSLRKP